ncbi:MAG TPA: hypothetical protein DDW55_07925 [Gammaproteobacteria bacterium]|nr:hypothetical protein [Gammaproteobacteria bacterium]
MDALLAVGSLFVIQQIIGTESSNNSYLMFLIAGGFQRPSRASIPGEYRRMVMFNSPLSARPLYMKSKISAIKPEA